MSHKTPRGIKAVKNLGAFTFAATLVGFVIRLIKNIIFTRLLGPTNRGIYGLFITLPNLIIGFGNLGFGLGNVYLVANQKRDLRKIFGNTLIFIILLSPFLCLIGYIAFSQGWILKGNSHLVQRFLPLILVAIPVILLFEFSTDLMVAIKDIRFVNILNLLLSAIPIVLFLLLWIWKGNPLSAAIYAWFSGTILVSLWAALRVFKKGGYGTGFDKKSFTDALSYGRRGFINIFANQLILRIDFLFISSMLGAKALGFYAVSVSLTDILLSLPHAFNLPFLPVRLGLDKTGSSDLTPIVTRHILFTMVLACGLTAVTGKIVIWILFGKDFLSAYSPLLWLLPGILFLSVYDFLRSDLYSHNRPGYVSWVSIAALCTNLLLNYLLIPRYGINGAAISSSLSYGLSTVLLLLKHQRLSGNSYRDILLIKRADILLIRDRISTGKR